MMVKTTLIDLPTDVNGRSSNGVFAVRRVVFVGGLLDKIVCLCQRRQEKVSDHRPIKDQSCWGEELETRNSRCNY